MGDSLNAVVDEIRKSEKFLVVSHRDPDGDAYSSSIAITLALKKMGKKVDLVNESGISVHYRFFPHINLVKDEIPDEQYDVVIVCDCAVLNRVGDKFAAIIPSKGKLINIDHHIKSNSKFGAINYLCDQACSTADMAYELIKALGVEFDKDIATLLLSGIYTDTVSLQRGIKSSETYNRLAVLHAAGANLEFFVNNFFWNKPPNLIKFESELFFSGLTLYNHEKYAEVIITDELLAKYNLGPKDCDSVKDKGLSIAGVMIASLIRFEDGMWKLSLRSKMPVDSNLIATALGGGGHPGASAVKWKGTLEELLIQVQAEVTKELARHGM